MVAFRKTNEALMANTDFFQRTCHPDQEQSMQVGLASRRLFSGEHARKAAAYFKCHKQTIDTVFSILNEGHCHPPANLCSQLFF